MSFKSSMLATGRFLRVLDEDNVISLTNLAVMLVIFKLAITPSLSMPEIGALLLGLFNYSYKRYVRAKEPKPEVIVKGHRKELNDLKSATSDLRDKVGQISAALSIRPPRRS